MAQNGLDMGGRDGDDPGDDKEGLEKDGLDGDSHGWSGHDSNGDLSLTSWFCATALFNTEMSANSGDVPPS